MVHYTSQDIEMPVLDTRLISRWIRIVAADYGYQVGEVNYIFCSDERELEVNWQFLQHDYYTDTITFDYTTETTVNGDIFISLDTVRSNAEMIGAPYEQELHRVIIHSLIHLTGQADKTPETRAEMTRKEERALAQLSELHLKN